MNHSKLQKWATTTCALSLLCVVLVGLILVSPAQAQTSVSVTINTGTVTGINKLQVGCMLDWETQSFTASSTLRQLSTSANFKLVRVFSVRIDPCTWWYGSSTSGIFNWAKVDTLIKDIFATGAEPLISFGHFASPGSWLSVPPGMATNPATGLPYPQSYGAYCADWVNHFQEIGLPVKYYEIINEPYFYFGWDLSETTKIGNFANLFNTVATAMRNVNPNVLISNDAFLQKKFLNYFVRHGVNLDFIDMHKYGLTEQGGSDSYAFSEAKNLYLTTETGCWYTLDEARQIWQTSRGKSLPVIITESNFSYAYCNGTDPRTQQMAGAVYTALVLKEAALRGISYVIYYTFASSPSQHRGSPGFGIINSDNDQPWYPYYVEKWIGTSLSVGDALYTITSSSSAITGFAWTHNQKLYFLFISQVNQPVDIYFNGIPGTMSYSKIDNTISYLTPKVQTGTLYKGQTFVINGYTVALFQSLY